ncbi:hypothetical protein [Microbulbifer thermotolerans]|uniref:AraC family transcriptional regulator n=1 Tax=Microbulbifer thermotolerans TaxID=252514 RepID=A0A143HQN0_MICTH|nr:hypothetical protein [Microbulbifer thermotolerans]AMX04033.1 hypothetical protein A3224_03835 [Microbulbifer thermotolerans]MCX2779284.1 hypothetical protein [Microbulbifer thermotolerans]MCX2783970.1 hypothetical protein [Microbulbifer thermotolerans]MCX2793491.1 hypothetical protein [Microbulbifer thermotolerans]MCX2802684.1 hypothetical protein [Microbulbifer thermotolerans]
MIRILQLTILLLVCAANAQDVSREDIRGLDEQIQGVKKDVIDLTAELTQLEEKLLFPSNTQVSFFVSLADLQPFDLEAVELKLNNEIVAHHLYTFREIEALQKGGVQKIYTGNVQTGSYPLEVTFIGKVQSGKEVKASASYQVDKEVGPKFVEIRIAGNESAINFKDW